MTWERLILLVGLAAWHKGRGTNAGTAQRAGYLQPKPRAVKCFIAGPDEQPGGRQRPILQLSSAGRERNILRFFPQARCGLLHYVFVKLGFDRSMRETDTPLPICDSASIGSTNRFTTL
ncbi:MAG: hypothetical protein WDN69_04250 [Aliidongia sp.]